MFEEVSFMRVFNIIIMANMHVCNYWQYLLQIDWKRYKKALKMVAFNIMVMGFAFNVLNYFLNQWRGSPCGYELPNFRTTVLHLMTFPIFNEIGLYYTHRCVSE